MQPMSVDPAVAAIGQGVVANSAQGLAANAAAAASVGAVAPAGTDEVSVHAATAFAAAGADTVSQVAAAQEELARAGAALTEIVGLYSTTDEAAADDLL